MMFLRKKNINDVFEGKKKNEQEHLGTRQEDLTFLFPFLCVEYVAERILPICFKCYVHLENKYVEQVLLQSAMSNVEQDWEGQEDSHHGQ